MQIVKVKGQPNRFLCADVKMSVATGDWYWDWRGLKITLPKGEILGRLRKLPKTGDLKRVFLQGSEQQKSIISFPEEN